MSKPGWVWPWALGTVLGLTVVGNLWVMRIANADPSFAVEPDYYRKAVDWDSTMAQGARNDTLGWVLAVESMRLTAAGSATVTVVLRDRAGAPLPGAVIDVAATHNARADQIVSSSFTQTGEGSYVATFPARRAGIWELRFAVRRGADRFTARIRHDTARDAVIR